MAEFEVTSLADSGAGTLREALAFAEANGTGTDTITFHSSLSGGTIFLQSQLTINSGAVNIIGDTDGTNGGFTEDNITISGDSNMSGGVPAAGDTRHMKIAAGATVNLSELILQNGYDNTSALGFAVGSIFNEGLLITNNVHFNLNSAFGPDGALTFTDGEPGTGAVIIANSGNMIMQETYFSGNRAGGGGGADGASGLGTGGENGGDGGIAAVVLNTGTISALGVGFDSVGALVASGDGGDGGAGSDGLPGGNGGNGGAVGTIINNGGNISGDFGYDNLITNGSGGAAGAAGPNPGETAGTAGSNGVGSFDLFDTGSGGSNTATTMLDASFGTYGNDTIDAPDAGTINPVSIYGFSGNDTLNAGANTRGDTFYGGVGRDTIRAGFGNDTLFGGADLDLLEGQGDDDTLRGGGGDDLLEGGAGLDMVFGEAGNDLMYLSAGESNAAETYDGGDGTDILQVRGASGNVFLNLATINAVETFQFSGNAGADIVAAFSGTQFGPGGLGNALIDGDGQSGTDNTIQIVLATTPSTVRAALTCWRAWAATIPMPSTIPPTR